MKNSIPIGEIVKLMERGVITIPSKYREKLNLEKGEWLNVFPWEGLLIVVPVKVSPKKAMKGKTKAADWTRDTPLQYMAKVRYTPLEKLWAKRVREGW